RGGMLWGIGQALLEATRMDPHSGRWANASLADYLVPVNADAPDVVVETIEVADGHVNPIGTKGVGEIGVVGAGAAIAQRRPSRHRTTPPQHPHLGRIAHLGR